MTTIEQAYNDLQDEREYATTQAAFIEKGPKREAFINKMTYRIGLRQKLILELMEKEKELEAMRMQLESTGGDEPPVIHDTKETKSDTAEIREILFFKGKEAARAETIARAKQKWPNLY